MSDISKYNAQKKKLEGLCEEHDFTFRLRKESWPITLTISPLQGMADQMSMSTSSRSWLHSGRCISSGF